jgi:molecular chaperone GrpE (heat shock protein)
MRSDNPFSESIPGRLSNVSNNNSILEHSLEIEDPKYKMMEQSIKEKEDEIEKLQLHSQELESKLQKLLSEFTQFRNKA